MTAQGITEGVPPVRHRRHQPFGWIILSGLLALVLLISWGVQSVRNHRQGKVTAAQVAKVTKARDLLVREIVRRKGESLVRALQVVTPELLTDAGQEKAPTLFADLITQDADIAYLMLISKDGKMRFTSDIALGRANIGMLDIEKVTLRSQAAKGADFEVVGPITDVNGEHLGVVRVGFTYPSASVPGK